MMDVPADNALPDPYGGAAQAAYPWRGSITLLAGAGRGGLARQDRALRPMRSQPSSAWRHRRTSRSAGDTVVYSGPDEWSLSRMVLHYAWLCKAAGGVDAFLIGSELRGLTTIRSDGEHLSLRRGAEEPRGGREERARRGGPRSPMPPTGANISAITRAMARATCSSISTRCGRMRLSTCVAIDNYMPLSDWRDGDDHLDAATWDSGRDAGLSPRQYRRRRIFRLVLCQRCRPRRAGAIRDQRRRLRQGLGVSPEGHCRLVEQPAFRPAGRRRSGNADRLGAGGQTDLVYRDRLPGSRQGAEPAQRLSRSESPRRAGCRIIPAARATTSSSGASSPPCLAFGTRTIRISMETPTRSRRSMAGAWSITPPSICGPGTRGPIRPFRCSPTSGRMAPTGRPVTG